MQNVASFFDNTLQSVPSAASATQDGETVSVFKHQHNSSKKQLVTAWLDGKIPTNLFELKPVDTEVKAGDFVDPVWVDLMTGRV